MCIYPPHMPYIDLNLLYYPLPPFPWQTCCLLCHPVLLCSPPSLFLYAANGHLSTCGFVMLFPVKAILKC